MKNRVFLGIVIIILAGCGASNAKKDAGAPPGILNSNVCYPNKIANATSETHRCYFIPTNTPAGDFSSEQSRAQMIKKMYSTECKKINILSDKPYTTNNLSVEPYRVVGFQCRQN